MSKQIRIFLSGIATIFTIMPDSRRTVISPIILDSRSDAEKLDSDWINIGKDIQKSVDQNVQK